ncbi:hypothetical protein BU25DRAFT_412467 [Macroventuria anomochaeta]|uniref:Uncharacterized protein n=1 Tax=Macroventuria anomochaeta TaxID=301207 RepID=A0ACB6RUY5_9PLEO|nr:uncharacterized protein BU25DRAFT_412467 [Macroventuria anomochaeta]KAF2625820.1 hypothetical protein BU25DRAFT_412467 [Macroventuria anomochaeta]
MCAMTSPELQTPAAVARPARARMCHARPAEHRTASLTTRRHHLAQALSSPHNCKLVVGVVYIVVYGISSVY